MRVQIENFEEGLIKRVSPEDLPKNALAKSENISLYDEFGVVKTRKGREKAFSVTFDNTLDVKYTSLFESNKVFTKGGTVLYRGIRPIKQNLSSDNRMDFTEFADWLIMCDGVNTLKYKGSMTLSWLVACCFDFEEANLPSTWTTHQSCIPFRVSHDATYACTYDWERAAIDGVTAETDEGTFYTSSCDVGGTLEASPPDADMLLHFDGSVSDEQGNHTPVAVGGAATTADDKKFGTESLYLDGTGDYVTVPDDGDFHLSDQVFTIDGWFMIPMASTKEEHCLFSQVDADGGISLWYSDETDSFHFWVVNGTQGFGKTYRQVITKGTWYHVALIRGWGGVSDSWALCLGGVPVWTGTKAMTLANNTESLRIGSVDAAEDGTLLDYSVAPNVVTYTVVAESTVQHKWGRTSLRNVEAEPNNTGEISVPQNANLTFQQDFTIDLWLYIAEWGLIEIAASYGEVATYDREILRFVTSGELSTLSVDVWNDSARQYLIYETDASPVMADLWFHLAVVRVGSDWGMYINGDQICYASQAATPTIDATRGSKVFFGSTGNAKDWFMDEFRWNKSNAFNAAPNVGKTDTIIVPAGRHDVDDDTVFLLRPEVMEANAYIDEFRWKKGVARWTETFDVPTEADTGIGSSVTAGSSLGGDMAVPLGMEAPSAALTATTGAAGLLTGDYYYKVTFVNTDSFESNPSPISPIVSPSTDKVSLTVIPQSNNPQVVSRNIYRTEAGGGDYYLITTIENNYTTTYTDNIADADLGRRIETNHDDPPALQAVHSHSSRLFGIAAEYPNKLVWCNAWDEWEYFDINNFEPFGSSSDKTRRLFTIGEELILIQNSKVWGFDTRYFPEDYWRKREGATVRGVESIVAADKVGPVILCADAEGGYLLDGKQSQSITKLVTVLFDPDSSDGDTLDQDMSEYIAVGYFKDSFVISYSHAGEINDRTIIYNKRTNTIDSILKVGFYSFSTNKEDKILYAAGTDGYIYRLFSGEDDAGSDISWRIQTKDFNGDIGPEMLLKEANFFWIDCNPNGNDIVVNVYLDNVTKQAKTISGSSRLVTAFRLPNDQFYRIMFDITGSGVQKLYRMAFEADAVRGPMETGQQVGGGSELVTALKNALGGG